MLAAFFRFNHVISDREGFLYQKDLYFYHFIFILLPNICIYNISRIDIYKDLPTLSMLVVVVLYSPFYKSEI